VCRRKLQINFILKDEVTPRLKHKYNENEEIFKDADTFIRDLIELYKIICVYVNCIRFVMSFNARYD